VAAALYVNAGVQFINNLGGALVWYSSIATKADLTEVKDEVKDSVAEVKGRVDEKVGEVKDRVDEKVGEVKDRMDEKVAEVKQSVAEVKQSVDQKFGEVKQSVDSLRTIAMVVVAVMALAVVGSVSFFAGRKK